ncbi:mandelate racemase/muconate lactonizing enzyme family protein [Portibacter lacus]|uniref:Dipeptide epimerase n=1 Tax=Portibacter lacus TaxID=1099794 RepID=A0AA37STC0_9BACT|nr:dipeptide epimerase [Portibacter lacus]GLR17748.1 dipeptide epimerase [Portibacter lacus]
MSTLKITRIEIIPIKIKLNEPFVISKGPLTHARNTVVIIHTKDGIFGTGECCPFRSIHGETQKGTVAAGKELAELLIGEDAREIHKIVGKIDKALAGNASIKCAIDMALYDLNAKAVNLPLFRYLQGDANKKMYTDMTISLLDKEKMAEKAVKYASDGFPVLKVKLGDRPAHKDIERIAGIRIAIGQEIPLRIDANQGWNYLESIRVLEGIQDMNIEHCEAPVPAGNIRDRRRLVDTSPIPIMGDEAIFNHHDAYLNLVEGAVDLINIKLGKSGGILHAMKIAGIAQAAGVYCQVGSFSETRLGISALAHFSMAWDNIIYYDMDSPLMQSQDPIQGGLVYQKDWQVTVDETPGIGATFDEKFLNKFEKLTIE